MADDNYQYQSIPLPPLPPFGGNAGSNSLSTSPPDPPNIQTANYIPQQGPFGDPSVDGGTTIIINPGGSCDDDFAAKDILANSIGFPCDTPTSSVSEVGAAFDDGAGNTAQIGVNGIVQVVFGGKTCTIDVSALPSGAVAQFREFEICGGQTAWVLATEPS